VTIFTIGFTQKSAERFFDLVCGSGARRLVDVRLRNASQLSGFAKRDDMAFFLAKICGIGYISEPLLAPEPAMLDAYRGRRINWDQYAAEYLGLLAGRKVDETVPSDLIDDSILLCSEDRPERCHRRLAAEYFAAAWGGVEIRHLR